MTSAVLDRLAAFPKTIHDRIIKFLLDNRTGNLTLNVKDGRVMGLKVEEHVRPDPP